MLFRLGLFCVLICVGLTLHVPLRDIEGTQDLAYGLTDKQLAIQRWLSSLTYLNREDSPRGDGWEGYLTIEENPGQVSNDALRYQLAHVAYSAVAVSYFKTPAYVEVTSNILKDSIERMIDWRVWSYVKLYWEKEKTYPDPVVYQNIMYSGHLATMIALYESITGDFSYTTEGWDFVTENGDVKIHYTAPKLMQVIYDQQNTDYTGGVSCEPNGRFIICNNFQRIAFALYDKIHGSNYSDLNEKWFDFINAEGRLPFWSSNGDRYLRIVQADYPPLPRFWFPLGAAGNDAWALSFMLPWIFNNEASLDWVCKGWEILHGTRMWRIDEYGYNYLSDEIVGQMFAFNDQFSTAFYTVVERQCISWAKNSTPEKTTSVYWHFEKSFGMRKSARNDLVFDTYLYNTTKNYRIMETSMLLLSMIINGNNTLWDIYNKPFIHTHKGEPILEHVPYPDVMVSYAQYYPVTKTLDFTVKSNSGLCRNNQMLRCANINTRPRNLFMNDELFSSYTWNSNGTLELYPKSICGKGVSFTVEM